MNSAAAEIGSTANNYQVLAKLATGGMAEIFLARSAGLGAVQRHVVLKRVLRERASDIHFMRMFLEEARLAAQLQHPNIAQVYDVGKLGDSYFFTMEYVHGETVRAVMQRAHQLRRSPPIGCVLAIAAGAAAGLHHAHERIGIEGVPLGIVHRDVSPSNLMIGYDGSIKVVDFGVAKATDRIQETQSGAVKGKISYLSPEQARGQKLDRRSDLFSLGIVMWELLTVERLYKQDSDFETMTAIINERPPPPSSRRRDVPRELDALVLRALAKSPDDRFQTAEELGEAIERVAVQTSSPLSAAGVTRFLRELFGTRPEPWVALQIKEERPEVVTVTSEPIPAEIKIPINDPIDRRLAAVVDLSAELAAAQPVIEPVIEPVTASMSMPRPPTGTVGPSARPPTGTVGPSARPPTGTVGPGARPPSVAAAAPSLVDAPAWTEPPPSNRLPIVLGVLALAFAAAIAVVVVSEPDDLAGIAQDTVPRQDAPAPEVAAPEVAVAEAATIDAVTLDAGEVVEADAAETGSGGDAGVEPISEALDAAGAPGAATADAGVAPAPGSDAEVTPPRRTRVRTVKPRPDLIRQFEAAHYAEVVAECAASTAADRVPCTLAACHLHDVAKARKWVARVPAAQRPRVIQACEAAGTSIEDAKPKKDCQADPMACPR